MSIDMGVSKKLFLSIVLLVIAIGLIWLGKTLVISKKEYTVIQNGRQPNFAPQAVTGDINQSWDHIELGNEYFKTQNYEKAAEEFRQAYSTTYGSKSLSGLKLARTYEKLERFDDGIKLLDDMIVRGYLSEQGIQNANDVKSRLLTAKSQAAQNAQAQPS